MKIFLRILLILLFVFILIFILSFKAVSLTNSNPALRRSGVLLEIRSFISRVINFEQGIWKLLPKPSPSVSENRVIPQTADSNPFGVMFGGKAPVSAATTLGVPYYRPLAVFVENWNGYCPECTSARSNNLQLILTVRNNGGPQNPTRPPKNLESYSSGLASLIGSMSPKVVAIENEENSELFYTGTPQQYLAELKAACDVAHQQDIKCTNGGLVSSLVALLVANSYEEKGQSEKASEYLTRTLGNKFGVQYGIKNPSQVFSNPKAIEQIKKGKELLAGYKNAGVDYVNFHWYIADPQALGEAVSYLRSATGGLQPMTNEIGQQQNDDPVQVTAVMQEVANLKLPYAVWFSVDVNGFGEAKGLVNNDGTLRPNGVAFQNFIKKNYK